MKRIDEIRERFETLCKTQWFSGRMAGRTTDNQVMEDIRFLLDEIGNIEGICDTYDEFGRTFDPECELTQLAGRVDGIMGELQVKADLLQSAVETMEPFYKAHMAGTLLWLKEPWDKLTTVYNDIRKLLSEEEKNEKKE